MLPLPMLTKPRILLHLEGAAILFLSVFFYRTTHASWLVFALLFLAPDLFMFGYLINARRGAEFYNLVHTTTPPLFFIAFALLSKQLMLLPYLLIWLAHIGIDRMLGYGLKYPANFKDTHLQHV
jgi:hypothetical protein